MNLILRMTVLDRGLIFQSEERERERERGGGGEREREREERERERCRNGRGFWGLVSGGRGNEHNELSRQH